ncbi:redoxin domain-containing protein [Melioribacteraceae bacterium 4301-Me]|uniref:redoxin domain-containing protein n=1 Tax=Pyranulibacter aquaticus TaxID=3163344 RepID=UPI003594E370
MKKELTAVLFIVIFITATIWVIVEGSKAEILPVGSKLPEIKLKTFYGLNTLKSNGYNKIIVIYFSKECSHCKYELDLLNKNINMLTNTEVYFITADKDYLDSEQIKEYKSLLQNKNVIFGVINKEEYNKNFGSNATPTLYFFNQKGILTSKIIGETKFERIIEELKKSDSPGYRISGSN